MQKNRVAADKRLLMSEFYNLCYLQLKILSSYNTIILIVIMPLQIIVSSQIELQPHTLYQTDQKSQLYNFMSATQFPFGQT